MHQSKIERSISLASRLLVAGVFLDAAVLKIWDPATFAEQTANYQLLSELSNYIAVVLPSIELVAALALAVGPRLWRDAAAFTLFAMLVVFTTAIARAWALGINLECGCFGAGSTNIGPLPILRNTGLAAALVLGFWLDCRTERLGNEVAST